MVKRLFKRSIACLMAVLMIATSLPLTALADSTTDNVVVNKTVTAKNVRTGLVCTDKGRWHDSYYEIVNDSTDDSFSIGYWQYDTSDFSKATGEFTSAPFDINFQSSAFAGETDTGLSLSVYYSTNNAADNYTGASTNGPGSVFSGSNHIANATSYYGLTKIRDIARSEITNGGTVTVDVKDAVNFAVSQKLKYVTIMVMCSAASPDGKPWSDIYVTASTPSITATYSEEVEVIPGVAGIDAQISAYEQKMAKVGTDGLVYKNMLPAYQAYLKAVRYRDAFAYGGHDAPTEAELNTASEDLASKSASMEPWVDEVTGQYKSKQPTFTNDKGQLTVNNTTEYTYYNNIIYTEDCVGKNYNKNGGDSSGMAIEFDKAGDTYVQVYYPNTVLLYDGTSSAIMPIMFMAKKDVNKNRYVYQVYPAQQLNVNDITNKTYAKTKPGNDPSFKGRSTFTTKQADTWKGGDGSGKGLNHLDFNACRNNGTNYVGTEVSNEYSTVSANLGYSLGGWWNAYAAAFQVHNDQIKFNGANTGYAEVGKYWAWYGGSSDTYNSAVDQSMYGYNYSKQTTAHSQKRITVVNYKGLVDAIKDSTKLAYLADVSNYRQNGLETLITAFDTATEYATYANIDAITISTISQSGKTIMNCMNGILKSATPVADTGAVSYAQLKSAISSAKKIYTAGNDNYEKYTKEVWDPFDTAYKNAINYFYNLYTNDLVMADAEQYIEPLNLAKENLKTGMLRKVVNTETLEIAINNADALIHNATYFKTGTVDAAALEALVKEIKTEIWVSEENYGFDTEKIDLNDANQAKVDNYVEQLCAEIVKAEINFDHETTSGYSLTTALAKAETYNTSDANEKYGNYVVLQDAVNSANTYKDSIVTFDGRVADIVENAITNYTTVVNNVVDGFTNLAAAFRLIPNGQPANKGSNYKTEFQSSARGDQYKFYWEYTTNSILFKTKPEKFEYYLPTSRWGSYNKQKGTDFESCVDALILDASKVQSGELSSTSTAGTGWPKNNAIGADKIDDYKAQLNLSAGIKMEIDNITVTKSTGKALGIDSQGNYITDPSHNFVTELGVTDNHASQPYGGIYAKNGWTEFDTKTKLTVDPDAYILSEKTTPSSMSKRLDLASTNAYFGVVYFWKYAPTNVVTWAGYGFERAKYNFNISFVNVVPLFDLIAQCTAKDFLATSNQYTTSSWKTLIDATRAANENFNYNEMSYSDILRKCDNRYTTLWNARKNLKKAANNTKLKEALAATKNAYENDQAKVKASSWTAFDKAYRDALAQYQGDFSDLNITDVAASEQSKVDAYATALTEAFNALVYQINFTPLKNAAETLVNSIAQNKYSKASVEELRDKLNALTYLNMSTVEQAKHYTDETEVVNAVNAEKTAIEGFKSLLKESTADTTALEGCKKDNESRTDPDAYDQDARKAALDALKETEVVNVRGVNITTKVFADQTDCDNAVKNALEGLQLKTYTVKIVPNGDENQSYTKGTYAYGTEVTVSLTDKPVVDWYYEMKSPSATVAKKLYTTTDELTFIVRGETTLTTKSASSSSNQCKISYVNGVNSSIVATDYVASGTVVTLDASKAPKLPYYTFNSFEVNGKTMKAGETVTITDNTYITLVYDFSNETAYTVYVCDTSYGYDYKFKVEQLRYNDEVVFTRGQKDGEGYYGYDLHYTVNRGNESNSYEVKDAGRYLEGGTPEVYAWVQVCADDLEDWFNHSCANSPGDGGYLFGTEADKRAWDPAAAAVTKGKVVAYGTDYSFRVHEDALLIPLDEPTYRDAIQKGVITEPGNEDGARVDTKSDLVIAQGTKASIISQFVLPQGCEMVEKGLLLKINKNGAVQGDGSDLKLANAGKNGVNRLKSNYTTSGNQFVISIKTSDLAGESVSEVGLQWKAYFTYRKADGTLVTEYSPVTMPTNTTDTF
ncbi:hypothetical protein [uncultured Eubacterium sp.]|uniref:hypothetical protein n=1 Tax=uncultured Eubacterium sp. TaxID=165185 RepID=UPI0025F74EFA|nr:hypothetical protein [uncultured Eubacterium sp.]